MEKSSLAFWHNQKEGGFDPETGGLHAVGSEEYIKRQKHLTSLQREKEIGTTETVEGLIKTTNDLINSIQLNEQSKDDPEQIDALEKRKEQIKNMIQEVLIKVKEYISIIIQQEKVTPGTDDFIKLDSQRTIRHNALISALTSTIKIINLNFKIPESDEAEDMIDQWENAQEEADKLVLDIKRINFPQQILTPDNINLEDRKQITDWALQLYEALSRKSS